MSIYRLSSHLEQQAQLLDISRQEQEWAIGRYDDLGRFLVDNVSGRADMNVYPQGSFRLGTVVKPADGAGDFDIDLVFWRDLARESVTQEELKSTAGELLDAYCTDRQLPEPIELGRCWRLDFFEQHFHLDVLPVIPDRNHDGDGILLSDRDLRLWLYSNPIGYADWFYDRMEKTLVQEHLAALAKALGRSVEDVPRFMVRTPLQRVVQLLKRSRDEYFSSNPEIKPASILVTTLAGQAYRGQRDVDNALIETARAMPEHIERRGGEWWVENPAHPGENFADKWSSNPDRRDAFFEWLSVLAHATTAAAGARSATDATAALKPVFGELAAEAASAVAGPGPSLAFKAARGEARAPREQVIEDMFPTTITHSVAISSEVGEPHYPNRYYRRRAAHRRRVEKGRSLRFSIMSTNVPAPYAVYWKVRNFGREAQLRNDLRGEIQLGSTEHFETTRYNGDHYIECYVVKEGRCIARTREWVPIE